MLEITPATISLELWGVREYTLMGEGGWYCGGKGDVRLFVFLNE